MKGYASPSFATIQHTSRHSTAQFQTFYIGQCHQRMFQLLLAISLMFSGQLQHIEAAEISQKQHQQYHAGRGGQIAAVSIFILLGKKGFIKGIYHPE